MAEVYGGKRVLAAAMGGVSVLTLLVPLAARQAAPLSTVPRLGGETGYPYALVVVRVLMGLCEAATFPCITSMLARWAPEGERAAMSTIIMSGSQVPPALPP
jgi:MFS family permease